MNHQETPSSVQLRAVPRAECGEDPVERDLLCHKGYLCTQHFVPPSLLSKKMSSEYEMELTVFRLPYLGDLETIPFPKLVVLLLADCTEYGLEGSQR